MGILIFITNASRVEGRRGIRVDRETGGQHTVKLENVAKYSNKLSTDVCARYIDRYGKREIDTGVYMS